MRGEGRGGGGKQVGEGSGKNNDVGWGGYPFETSRREGRRGCTQPNPTQSIPASQPNPVYMCPRAIESIIDANVNVGLIGGR